MRQPCWSVMRSWAPGWGRSRRAMIRIPGGQPTKVVGSRRVSSATWAGRPSMRPPMWRGTPWWWARPDDFLQLLPSSRFTKNPELLAPYQVNAPLWATHTIVVDPKIPRTDEATGTEDAHPFVSVLGAAWLLMSQTNITETRQTEPTNSPEVS